MKQNEIKVGAIYLAKVSNKVVPVHIDAESRHGGWDATNLLTDKKVRIKSAQSIRCPANRDGSPQAKPEVQAGTDTGKAPKAGKKAKAAAEKSNGKLSAIDAAAQVLANAGQAMNTKEMIEAMTAKGLWSSPKGKTPHATLYAAILRELTVKKGEARFKKVERGKFAATGRA